MKFLKLKLNPYQGVGLFNINNIMAEEQIVNRIAKSGLITLDLEKILPPAEDRALLDIKPFLFKGLIVKEKEFREGLMQHNWQQYEGKYVGVWCSTDAIVPQWAYMLITTYLSPLAKMTVFGGEGERDQMIASAVIRSMDVKPFDGQRVVVKGCGEGPVTTAAYLEITGKLLPVVKSLMYGEPCSTVPIYKRK